MYLRFGAPPCALCESKEGWPISASLSLSRASKLLASDLLAARLDATWCGERGMDGHVPTSSLSSSQAFSGL